MYEVLGGSMMEKEVDKTLSNKDNFLDVVSKHATTSTIKPYFTDLSINNTSQSQIRQTSPGSTINNLEKLLSSNFVEFWAGMTTLADMAVKSSTFTFLERNVEGYKRLFSMATNKSFVSKLLKEENFSDYINGLTYFLERQTYLDNATVNRYIDNSLELLFLGAIQYGSAGAAKVMSSYNTNHNLEDSKKLLEFFANNHDLRAISRIVEYSNNVNFDNSRVLKICLLAKIDNVEFYKKLIHEYKMDLNAVGEKWFASQRTNLAYEMMNCVTVDDLLFKNFLKQFGQQVDFNAVCVTHSKDYQYNKDIVDTFIEFSPVETHIKLHKFNSLLSSDIDLSVKTLSQIAGYLMKKDILANYYDHPVYDTLFSHRLFLNSDFSHESVPLHIIVADNSQEMKYARIKHKHLINPTTVLLKKYMKYAGPLEDNGPSEDLFYVWASSQNKHFCNDTYIYLLDLSKDNISKLTEKELLDLPSCILNSLEEDGFKVPEHVGSFQKFVQMIFNFLERLTSEKQVTVQKDKTIVRDKTFSIDFNQSLFEQIKDEEIKRYISSIVLNAEQFSAILPNQHSFEQNEHYVFNLLPKLLNQTVQNYMHFNTVEPVEARNNVLTQLKLLNKKTFSVLNDILESQTASAATESRVTGKLIKRYDQ